MKDLKRMLVTAIMMLCIVPVGAFAQRGQKPPPPKEDRPKVVVGQKPDPPPNNNGGRDQKKRGDRKGRP
jgi:Spy/CpxP family protein refolding chaperone